MRKIFDRLTVLFLLFVLFTGTVSECAFGAVRADAAACKESEAVYDAMKNPAAEDFAITALEASQETESVEEKVDQIAAECRAEGLTEEYDIALWLHDWLIYHADYDSTYTQYGPEGVLLEGTGVCQSYSEAYSLLLDEFSIENKLLVAPDMDEPHEWNLVNLDGEWSHVDCTWDDPVTDSADGGAETHVYFCMDDALMSRDHIWDKSAYPACTSKANYYYVRNPGNVEIVESEEELTAFLEDCASRQMSEIECCYIGEDADFSLRESFDRWFSEYDWKFGLLGYGISGSQWMFRASIKYGEPWEKPSEFTGIADCPNFVLRGPEGTYRLSDYSDNGMVLIFGRELCLNTRALLGELNSRTESLNQQGVGTFMVLESAVSPDDAASMKSDFPNFTYVYEDGFLMSDLMEAVGDTSPMITYPLVFVIDRNKKIVHYSTGFVDDVDGLMEKISGVATGQPLPAPEAADQDYWGSAFNYTGDEAALRKMIEEQLEGHYNHILVHDGTWAGNEEDWDYQNLASIVDGILSDYRGNTCLYDISDLPYPDYPYNIFFPVTFKSGHELTEIPETEPTCTKDGNHAYMKCTVCGRCFKEDGETETTVKDEKIKAPGHSPVLQDAREPSETEAGYTGDRVCSVCGALLEKGKEIPRLGRQPNSITASSKTFTVNAKKNQTWTIGAKAKGSAKLTYKSSSGNVTVDGKGKVVIKKGFVGKAVITIIAAETPDYEKTSKEITVTVKPAKMSIKQLTSPKKKQILVTWKKDAKVSGYEIQYSLNKKFKSGKTLTAKKNQTVSQKISKLTSKKTYYVRIRGYKTSGGTKIYGDWSIAKTIKVK